MLSSHRWHDMKHIKNREAFCQCKIVPLFQYWQFNSFPKDCFCSNLEQIGLEKCQSYAGRGQKNTGYQRLTVRVTYKKAKQTKVRPWFSCSRISYWCQKDFCCHVDWQDSHSSLEIVLYWLCFISNLLLFFFVVFKEKEQGYLD